MGKILFNIPIEGSILLLYAFGAVYLLVVLGMGLLMSAASQTQQQVMFLSFFFMLTFILMSGIFHTCGEYATMGTKTEFHQSLCLFHEGYQNDFA
jgi:ABC-type transport system involved in multi-copper enzyme maturation permease subunit